MYLYKVLISQPQGSSDCFRGSLKSDQTGLQVVLDCRLFGFGYNFLFALCRVSIIRMRSKLLSPTPWFTFFGETYDLDDEHGSTADA